ncbi:MAG: hypothetical protein LBF00_01625, partial [Mycoplasmataceae bacterium]|nr:hypothetical protein [Mycoplasmataceae bacterium]
KLGLIISSIALVTMGGGIGIGYAVGHNNKSSNYEKDFYTMDEFMNFAKDSHIIKDKQTFKDALSFKFLFKFLF